MALTQDKQDKIAEVILQITKLDSGEGIVYFKGEIPDTVEKMSEYIKSDEGLETIAKFALDATDETSKLSKIDNIIEFLEDIVDPAVIQKDHEIKIKAEAAARIVTNAVRKKADSNKMAKVAEAALKKERSAKKMKFDILDKEDKAKEIEAAARKKLEEARLRKKELSQQLKIEDSIITDSQLNIMSAELSLRNVSFMKVVRQTGIGGAKLTGAIVASADTVISGYIKYYANEFKKLASRKFDSTSKEANKMLGTLFEGAKNCLKAAGEYLVEVGKYLDPNKKDKRLNEKLDYALSKLNKTEESLARQKETTSLLIQHKEAEAAYVLQTLTPSEAAEKARAEAELAKENARILKETREANEKFASVKFAKETEKEIREAYAKKDKEDLDKATGRFGKTYNAVVDTLRGKVSPASDAEGSKGPDAGGRERSDSGKSI